MAPTTASSSNSHKNESLTPVNALHQNDVLLGRGSGSSRFIGNQSFRDIVKEHRQEYLSTKKHKVKNEIARKVYDAVHASGGRFLRPAEESELLDHSVVEATWYECDEKTALEKCRQSLRQKVVEETKKPAETPTDDGSVSLLPLNNDSPIPPMTLVGFMPPPIIDARVLLFQMQSMFHAPQLYHVHPGLANVPFLVSPLLMNAQQQQQCIQSPTIAPVQSACGDVDTSAESAKTKASTKDDPSDDEVSDYLLSVLALSGRSKFTDEQDEEEKANMTDEERARVLCDLFGKYCNVHQTKKARRDLGKDEISFLINQMRIELNKIPDMEKEALMEAQLKCANRTYEFSDSRLEHFLRCEGMDVKVSD